MKPADQYAPRPHYDINDLFAIDAAAEARAAFLRKTYAHLFLAILSFLGLTAIFLQIDSLTEFMVTRLLGGIQWILVLVVFMVVSWVADRWARSDTSIGVQYAGLALYTVAEALIFVPLLFIVSRFASWDVVPVAGIMTVLVTTVITGIVFISGKDFSFIRPMLTVLGIILLGAIVMSWIWPLRPVVISSIGVAFAGGMVLYSTSEVLHNYRTDQYVAASLSLFASIALLFWYLIQLVWALDD